MRTLACFFFVSVGLLSVCCAAPAVTYMGRVAYDPNEPHRVQYDWSGIELGLSGFEVTRPGASVSILLQESLPVGNIYEVIVDSVVRQRINTTNTQKVYVLAKDLQVGRHNLIVRKLTEADFGLVSFLGFLADGQVIFNPPGRVVGERRRIEALGASFTCGYGIEGHYPCRYTPYTENYSKTYAAVIARTLKAEYHVECWSGKGVVRNYGWPNITAPDPFPVDFPRTLANVESSRWDFDEWQPQVVLLNLGSNDFSSQPTPPATLFESRVIAFLEGIRQRYADVGDRLHIVYSCGPKPIMTGVVCDYIKAAASRVRNVHYIDIQDVLDIPQDLGCDNHPNEVGQRKMAEAILPVVRRVTGWN